VVAERDDGDRALERLGIFRIPVPVPFPQAGGPVNVVAVLEEGGGLAFVDAGLGTDEAEAALRAGLAARGFAFADARRILLTHGHVDHYGLCQTIRDESGASVRVHPADRRKVTEPDGLIGPEYADFLLRAGARREDLGPMLAMGGATGRYSRAVVPPVGELADGERYRFARCEATVREMPGHTPGLVCLELRPLAGEGPTVVVASDHLLEKVSPNPILELSPGGERFRALPTYLASLRRLAAIEADLVLPGHGPCFSDHRRVIAALEDFYERRFARLLDRLPAAGASPAELVRATFPERGPVETFLMLGEVLGYLDVLEGRGRVEAVEEAGALRYRPVPAGP
jgi:glyoxylase-like metal-dependent hydrolase (beta-lactamase superfamily II)